MTQKIEWLRSDSKTFEVALDGRPGGGGAPNTDAHHGFLYRPGREVFDRLCLAREGESPHAVHILRNDSFCASCIRRSLEIFR